VLSSGQKGRQSAGGPSVESRRWSSEHAADAVRVAIVFFRAAGVAFCADNHVIRDDNKRAAVQYQKQQKGQLASLFKNWLILNNNDGSRIHLVVTVVSVVGGIL
jgi:hypothetical protein